MNAAFVSGIGLRLSYGQLRHLCARTKPRPLRAASWQMTKTESEAKAKMEISSAERTRQALSKSPSKVKFRRSVAAEEPDSFSYTSGVTSGIDIWLVAGILAFVIPFAILAYAISTGIVDINPR